MILSETARKRLGLEKVVLVPMSVDPKTGIARKGTKAVTVPKVSRYVPVPAPTVGAKVVKTKAPKVVGKRPPKGLVDSCGNRWVPLPLSALPTERMPKKMAEWLPRETPTIGYPSGVAGKCNSVSLASDVLHDGAPKKSTSATEPILNEL